MNEPTQNQPTDAVAQCCAEMDQCVRRNPSSAILIAVGAGLAIGMLIRSLRPESAHQHRIALLEDLEDRLRDAVGPVLRKASSLASDGLDAAHDGRSRAESLVSDATRRLRRMFS